MAPQPMEKTLAVRRKMKRSTTHTNSKAPMISNSCVIDWVSNGAHLKR